MDKLHEECAVFGISTAANDAVGLVYNALLSLQHRGQEGAGIAAVENNNIVCKKGVGLVSEALTSSALESLPKCKMAIGHNRYSTTGNNTKSNVQPFVTEYLIGRLATAHNGNIVNAKGIKDKLIKSGVNFNATSDSEVISDLIAYETIQNKDLISGIISACKQLVGAYSLLVLSSDNTLVAIRDNHGYRPLCIGKNANGLVVSSESCALDCCGYEFVRDVEAGEIIVIRNGEIVESRKPFPKTESNMCVFEYVYFARTDSIIDGQSVYEARYNMGRQLAKMYKVDADMVCGVPDSGLESAAGYAEESGIPLRSGFVKNRYIGRSFIYPTQAERMNAVNLKLNPLCYNISGKRIVLVDDSIVRGTTMARIISTLRHAGAKEIHLRIASPPFVHTCYFGTDIGQEENLIANRLSVEEIRKKVGADSLGYINIEGLKASCNQCKLSMCTGCFDGNYGISINSLCEKGALE